MQQFTDRQIEIMEAATNRISKYGIQNLTIKTLAEDIGLSEPALYRHFKSKNEILLCLLEYFKTEMKNLHMYGYGLKSMMLSMIETACRITGGKENLHCAEEIIRLGQELLQKPVTLLDGVEDVLLQLQGKYKLVLATKGDLFDQKRKVMDSGLVRYFCHIEIMSDKKEADYQKLLNTVGCAPQNFLMLGNSIKSDILPMLNLGGYAAHIPYHITWQYENHEGNVTHPNFLQLKNIKDIIGYLL